jgi:hypothetical protein
MVLLKRGTSRCRTRFFTAFRMTKATFGCRHRHLVTYPTLHPPCLPETDSESGIWVRATFDVHPD